MIEDKNSRCRNWSVVIYEDSAPTAWREYLDNLHIEWEGVRVNSSKHSSKAKANCFSKHFGRSGICRSF